MTATTLLSGLEFSGPDSHLISIRSRQTVCALAHCLRQIPWSPGSGNPISLSQMGTGHIRNAAKKLRDLGFVSLESARRSVFVTDEPDEFLPRPISLWLDAFRMELRQRG